MTIRIGTSGWSYAHWEPELYPPGLPAAARRDRYAAAFGTAELNSSFYRWPRPGTFRYWKKKLPAGFCLSVKASRGLTHARKLYGPETWVQRMSAGWHELGDKRAVLLAQLGPAQARDDARLAYFLGLVPEWMRVAVEFRHSSWPIREWDAAGRDVFAYFNNDGDANAVRDARALRGLLGQEAAW